MWGGITPEVLVCDVIGRYDICEVLPVVASGILVIPAVLERDSALFYRSTSLRHEVLVCDVIGRYDICEVLPVVASGILVIPAVLERDSADSHT